MTCHFKGGAANRACNVVSARCGVSMCVFLFERRATLGWAEPLGRLFFFLPLFLSWIKFHPGVLRLFYAPEGGGLCV